MPPKHTQKVGQSTNRLGAYLLSKQKKYSTQVLSVASFLEAVFSPIPVEFFLVPLCIQNRSSTFRYAFYAALFSVLGGVAGYGLGLFLTDWVMGVLDHFNYLGYFAHAKLLYTRFGDVMLFLAAFTPIPFKVFCALSGMLNMSLINFIGLSLLGRGLRFFLVAWVVYRFGQKIYEKFEKQFWYFTIALVVLVYLVFKVI